MDKELILIIDFYGQYNQLIARRVRECNVYSEIVPFSTSIEKIKQKNPKGIIFTGGPAIRVIGDITENKLDILKDADSIFREEVAKAGWDRKINQYFAVLTNIKSVGVMGDERTYDYTIALRAVTTSDFMTAEWTKIPYEILEIVSSRIVNEVKHVNRVVYDITGKPPATIEWE